MDILNAVLEVLGQFAGLLGVAALLSLLVNAGKRFGLVPDGSGGKVFAGLQLVAVAARVFLRLYAPFSLVELDAKAAEFAQAGAVIFGYIVSLRFGQGVHYTASEMKLPVVGFEFPFPLD